jgi:hypothetical protein
LEEPPYAQYKLSSGEPVCLSCLKFLEPTSEKVKNFTSRELFVLCEIQRCFPELEDLAIEVRCDQTTGGCSRKRPDMIWDFGSMIIWLEINEHQHASYDPSCEKTRREHIWEDFGCRPALLVEFNPDEYVTDDGQPVRGMFRENRNRFGDKRLVARDKEFRSRMDMLIQTLRDGVTVATSEEGPQWSGIHQTFLFYDSRVQSEFSVS